VSGLVLYLVLSLVLGLILTISKLKIIEKKRKMIKHEKQKKNGKGMMRLEPKLLLKRHEL
jgi:hypothetical protein